MVHVDMADTQTSSSSRSVNVKTAKQPFVEPLLNPSSYSLEDVRAVFIDAILITHYVHTHFPYVLNDTLSIRDIRFHRTASQDAVCVLVDLDGVEHPSNESGRPSSHGTIPFTAYDMMHRVQPDSGYYDSDRPSLYTPAEDVNPAAPYRAYRHILEGLFYMLLWCVSGVPNQTLGWMERGHVARHELLRVVKHPKDRESFMWDATHIFAGVSAKFKPLVEAWLRPFWMLLSEGHFLCRFLHKEERSKKLGEMVTVNQVIDSLRGEDVDVRIAALIPLPADKSDEGW
ncbi:hypothetical protein FB451DRAFT_634014 [Mycena latifolia]|nr:hypothetical protein FB451DRAFT_634014 [Mycena latifolia]